MAKKNKNTEQKATLSDIVLIGLDKIRQFLYKHRKAFIISLIGILIVLSVGGVIFAVQRLNENKALNLFYQVNERLPKDLPDNYNLQKFQKIDDYSNELSIPADFKSNPDLNKIDILLPKFREVVDKSSSTAKYISNFYIGLLSYFKKDYNTAISAFEKTAKKRSFFIAPVCQYNLGICYEQIKDYESAIKEYQKIENFFPNNPLKESALLQVARCYQEMEKFDDAITYCEKLEAIPNNSYSNEVRNLKIIIEWKKAQKK